MSVKAFCSVKTLRIDKRKSRLKTSRGAAGGFLRFYSNSFSSPRSRPLDVRAYAVGSRTGILHSPAPVEAALAGASRFEDHAGVTRFGILRDFSLEILFFALDRRSETIYN